jgi:hypothetical protein
MPLAAGLLISAFFLAAPAQADIGVERISPPVGAPGVEVDLTIGCGFCRPGRNPSFPISLAPIGKALPYRCGPRMICTPQVLAPPAQPPFVLVGRATPSGGGDPDDGILPSYRLRFPIPDLRPGVYTVAIYAPYRQGRGGSLITDRSWRLRVLPK